jgi:hypothetical protein
MESCFRCLSEALTGSTAERACVGLEQQAQERERVSCCVVEKDSIQSLGPGCYTVGFNWNIRGRSGQKRVEMGREACVLRVEKFVPFLLLDHDQHFSKR